MRNLLGSVFLAASLACVGTLSLAQAVQYTAALTGADEVPANDSKGSGSLAASYDPKTRELKWRIEYSGLTGEVTAAHFHGPAEPGKNASPVVPLSGSMKSPIEGRAILTSEQAKELVDGKIYFNLHTAKHKDGELRGQMKQTM
jgi:hypothetical protein